MNIKCTQKTFSRFIHQQQQTCEKAKRTIKKQWFLDQISLWLREFIVEPSFPSTLCWTLHPFGSSELCPSPILNQDSDLDLLCFCLSSPAINRQTFLTKFSCFLQTKKEAFVSQCVFLEHAFVPALTFRMHDSEDPGHYLDVDFLFASSSKASDASCLLQDSFFQTLETKDALCVSGYRVTEALKQLLETTLSTHQKRGISEFVCVVKYWAKQKKLYSNALGFLGGISWLILCVKICHMYPSCSSTCELFLRFFQVYAEWPWPHPIQIHSSSSSSSPSSSSRGGSFLPIVLPVYPYAYSTYNVCLSTFSSLLYEWKQASQCLVEKSQSTCSVQEWSAFFVDIDFFHLFTHFLEIKISSDASTFLAWKGWVQSRLRYFVLHLEQHPCLIVRPYTHSFESGANMSFFYIGFLVHTKHLKLMHHPSSKKRPRIQSSTPLCVDLSAEVEQFKQMVLYQFEQRTKDTTISIQHLLPVELSLPSSSCLSSEKTNKKMTLDEFNSSSSSLLKTPSVFLEHPHFQEKDVPVSIVVGLKN